jgi:hypothetical protein
MLTAPDADLARRDGALPGLATLLDPDAFVAALRLAAPALCAEDARVTYVRYKPGTNCLVGYRIEAAGETTLAFATAYRGDDRDKWAKHARGGRIVLEGRRIIVRVFPDDDLRGLSRLADSADRHSLLREVLPGRPDLWGAALDVLRYKPRRRYVGLLSTPAGPGAVLKAYTAAGYAAALAGERAVRPAPCRPPRRLGRSRPDRLLAFAWRPGRLLSEALSGPGIPAGAVAAAGADLAGLHRHTGASLIPRARQAEARLLLELGAWLGHVCPAVAGRAAHVAGRVTSLLPDVPAPESLLHGDFHPGQVLIGTDGVALLDFDEAARGDPALDLGTFLAHVEGGVIRGHFPAGVIDPVRAALLDGYRSAGGRAADGAVDVYTVAGLLRVAPEPFRAREPGWPERTARVLDRAEALLRSPATRAGSGAAVLSGWEG